jgi:hypothetical protein
MLRCGRKAAGSSESGQQRCQAPLKAHVRHGGESREANSAFRPELVQRGIPVIGILGEAGRRRIGRKWEGEQQAVFWNSK